jgi:hypothetical protein
MGNESNTSNRVIPSLLVGDSSIVVIIVIHQLHGPHVDQCSTHNQRLLIEDRGQKEIYNELINC